MFKIWGIVSCNSTQCEIANYNQNHWDGKCYSKRKLFSRYYSATKVLIMNVITFSSNSIISKLIIMPNDCWKNKDCRIQPITKYPDIISSFAKNSLAKTRVTKTQAPNSKKNYIFSCILSCINKLYLLKAIRPSAMKAAYALRYLKAANPRHVQSLPLGQPMFKNCWKVYS